MGSRLPPVVVAICCMLGVMVITMIVMFVFVTPAKCPDGYALAKRDFVCIKGAMEPTQ